MADTPQRRSFPLKIILTIVVILAVAILAGGGIYYFTKGRTQTVANTSQNTTDEAKQLVEEIGKIYDLPTGEVPTIATVSDVSKLSSQEFFKRAQNGDKVLIYTQAKKAILYRPSTNKIIEVGPVNINNEPQVEGAANASASAKPTGKAGTTLTPAPKVKVSLLNGTKAAGLTKRMETSLGTYEAVPTEVVDKSNAVGDYEETVVIDVTGKNAATVKKLATFAKGKVALLPKGEAEPTDADILIILGNNYITP